MEENNSRKRVRKPDRRKSRSDRKSKKRRYHGNQYTKIHNVNADSREADSDSHVNNNVNSTASSSVPVSIDSTLVSSVPVHDYDPDFHVNIVPASSSHHDDLPPLLTTTTTTPTPTVSEKKVGGNMDSYIVKKRNEFIDNEIMDMEILAEMFNILCCPECKNSGIKLQKDKRYGLATKCKLLCTTCCYEKIFWTSRKVERKEGENRGKAFEVNQRLTYSMRSIGVGLKGSETFLSLMNLPPPVHTTVHDKNVRSLNVAVKSVATDAMMDACEEIRHAAPTDITETSVSCDGTWQKRGHVSLNGAVAVLSTVTGKVLDIEVMSRYCNKCTFNEKRKYTDPDKYAKFKTSHVCMVNHKGSAPAMERDGTVNIFQRSMSTRNLQYTTFVGDGDTKSFTAIENMYPGKTVVKHECVGHVQKRFGKRLRELKKNVKGLGGLNRLTEGIIDKFQLYYGIAIRQSAGKGVEGMKKAIWGGFFHVASSKDQHWHDHCEPGPDSWCKYQVDIAKGTKTYTPGRGIPLDVIKHVKPILQDLTKDELLMKCLHGKTQNQNESFNGMVWNRAPKGTYIGLPQLEIAVHDAISHFNMGSKAAILVLERLGIRPGNNTISGCARRI